MTINGKNDINSVLLSGIEILSNNKSISSPRLDAEILLCHLLNLERIDLVLKKDTLLSDENVNQFLKLIKRRLKNEPVSYITGEKEFMSLPFRVLPGVLIPRPETELLAERLVEEYKNDSAPQILDLCTGSGAIAISIAYYLKNALVTAVDKFDVCVKTARENAQNIGVEKRVEVIKADVFEKLPLVKTFDCIVSNPPYIEEKVLSTLPSDVKNHEPMYALDGGTDGLDFYRRIIAVSEMLLKPNGLLAFEIGYDQGKSVSNLIKENGKFDEIKVLKDYAGQDRIVTAYKKGTNT